MIAKCGHYDSRWTIGVTYAFFLSLYHITFQLHAL